MGKNTNVDFYDFGDCVQVASRVVDPAIPDLDRRFGRKSLPDLALTLCRVVGAAIHRINEAGQDVSSAALRLVLDPARSQVALTDFLADSETAEVARAGAAMGLGLTDDRDTAPRRLARSVWEALPIVAAVLETIELTESGHVVQRAARKVLLDTDGLEKVLDHYATGNALAKSAA